MKKLVKMFLAATILCSTASYANEDKEYPHRAKYPDIAIYALDKLGKDYDKVQLVDVRSRYEFDTLHIKGAVNIPLSHAGFPSLVKKLSTQTKKPLVFYCNGKTCAKSYKGCRQAARAGLKNIFAFDAGVFDWAKANPDKTVLLGNSPVNSGDLISKKELNARMLSPGEFTKRVERGGKISVVDVRDRIQRDVLLFPFNEKRFSLNEEDKLTAHLKKEAKAGKTLFIYDKVGKQVRWLQYRLHALGIRDYYFMKGGSEAMYKTAF